MAVRSCREWTLPKVISFVTLRAERRSAPWCAAESREVSSRQQGAEWQLAESRVKVRKNIVNSLPSSTKMLVLPLFTGYSEDGRDNFLFHISSIFSSISNEWTSATSRKINGSYSEISGTYSQITKGYWRAIWHWLVTLRAERRSAPCCPTDSREVSSRQQGAEQRLAGKVLESILSE